MADNLLYYKAVVYKDAVHRPLGADERLTTDSIPISALGGNQIRANADGLYVGPYVGRAVYYADDVTGRDEPDSGSKEKPFQTMDYALTRIQGINGGDDQVSYAIALKAGGTFSLTKSVSVSGNVIVAFYGDPKYGDFNDPGRFGQIATYMPVDLQRPIINVGTEPTTVGGIAGFVMNSPLDGGRARITFSGVRMNMPPGVYETGSGAIVVVNQKTDAFIVLEGSVVNAVGDNSIYGFLGVLPSASAFLYQYASKFLVDGIEIGAQPTPPPTAAQLQRRKWFIRMYPDFAAITQSGYDPFMIEASPGSALLNLSWTDTPTATTPLDVTVQNTWPVLTGDQFGFGQYVTILRRDNQGRPLNIISGRLFSLAAGLLCLGFSLMSDTHNLIA